MQFPGNFDVARFEHQVLRGEHEQAAQDLLTLLASVEQHYGQLGALGNPGTPGQRAGAAADSQFLARLAAAVGFLFADPEFKVTDLGFQKFLAFHRWIAMMFAASAFDNADHVIHLFAVKVADGTEQLNFSGNDLLKLTLLYGLESDIPIQPDALWSGNPAVAMSIGVALLSSRICISDRASAKRDVLLAWLPGHLDHFMLSDANLQALDDAYMHCSYASVPGKHDIKAALNRQARRRMEQLGCADVPAPDEASSAMRSQRSRPVMVVACEWMNSNSAMYRCYAPSIDALREKFELHALVRNDCIDDVAAGMFDQVIPCNWNGGDLVESARDVVQRLHALQPDAIFYPSVGMSSLNVILSTFRLAPLQFMCLGHPATSRSPYMDYVAVEEGFLGDPGCFSERLLVLPNQSQPWVPPHGARRVEPDIRARPACVRIVVTASSMKLNPGFLGACRAIAAQSPVAVEFHFFCGEAVGLAQVYAAKSIRQYVPDALVFPPAEYNAYIEALNQCDLFLSPFPFGNTNGIVDAVRQGIPGVCLDGPEVHSHIDAELFRRLSLPEWLVTKTQEDYVAAALRLVVEHDTRHEIATHLLQIDPDAILFQGDAKKFLDAVWWLHCNYAELQGSAEKVLRAPL